MLGRHKTSPDSPRLLSLRLRSCCYFHGSQWEQFSKIEGNCFVRKFHWIGRGDKGGTLGSKWFMKGKESSHLGPPLIEIFGREKVILTRLHSKNRSYTYYSLIPNKSVLPVSSFCPHCHYEKLAANHIFLCPGPQSVRSLQHVPSSFPQALKTSLPLSLSLSLFNTYDLLSSSFPSNSLTLFCWHMWISYFLPFNNFYSSSFYDRCCCTAR